MLQATTVRITFNDTEEYSLRSIAILGCNRYSQITVAHVTLPKAVLSTVKIFAVYCNKDCKSLNAIQNQFSCFETNLDYQTQGICETESHGKSLEMLCRKTFGKFSLHPFLSASLAF